MNIEFDMWYHDNKFEVDNIVTKILKSLEYNVLIPKSLPYDLTFDYETLRSELIEYLYINS
jgi:hypothetical protein